MVPSTTLYAVDMNNVLPDASESTSQTLLRRAQQQDGDAWRRVFVNLIADLHGHVAAPVPLSKDSQPREYPDASRSAGEIAGAAVIIGCGRCLIRQVIHHVIHHGDIERVGACGEIQVVPSDFQE
jgi:hypothetical protein